MIFEGFALRIAWREFQHFRRENPGSLWRNLRDAKDLALPTVLFEDTAAMLGLIVAFLGIFLGQVTGTEDVVQVADRVLKTIERPFTIDEARKLHLPAVMKKTDSNSGARSRLVSAI